MRKILLGLCLLGGAFSLGSSPALAQVAASTVVLSGTSGNTCVYTGVTMQPNGGISVTCSGGAATAPGAPTIGVATPGDTSASIAFAAPASNGGAAITAYTASCSVNGLAPFVGTQTGAASPINVTGLSNATAYLCSVTATNSVGTGVASGTVSVTPSAPVIVPNPPVIGAATPGNLSASIAFSPPVGGGGGILDYTAACSVNGLAPFVGTQTGASSPLIVAGLVNGTAYLCSVTARNVVGSSAPSGTVSVTPAAPTAPGAPTGVTLTPGNGSISVAFTAPASNGGAAITRYDASCTSSDGGLAGTGFGASSPITVSGLDNGKTYTCTVTATNSVGPSDPSAASASTQPVAGCGVAPVGTTVVSWTGYNNRGATVETGTISTGASKAYRFTASSALYPTGSQVQFETSTYSGGSNRADITIATCPGVFTSPQAACVLTYVRLGSKLTSFDPAAPVGECILQNGVEYYVNIRPNAAFPNVAKVIASQGR